MTATVTQVVKQFQQDWTGQLDRPLHSLSR